MATKRRSRSRSRTRSRSKHRPKPEPTAQERIYANFVVPLAGVLSSIAARIYDMGSSPASSSKLPDEEQNGNERTPLLPRPERVSEESSVSTTKKAARWMAHNAVIVFMTSLIASAIIILCVFFGGEFCEIPPPLPIIARFKLPVKYRTSANSKKSTDLSSELPRSVCAKPQHVSMPLPKSSTTSLPNIKPSIHARILNGSPAEGGTTDTICGQIKEMLLQGQS